MSNELPHYPPTTDEDYSEPNSIEIRSLSSVASNESTLSAARLATHTEYAVIWELLNFCQEAAFDDIPEQFHDYLAIFDTKHDGSARETSPPQRDAVEEGYDGLFQAAGATKTCGEPWALPAPAQPLSHEDALWRRNVRVLSVSQVIPTAAIYLTPDSDLEDVIKRFVCGLEPGIHSATINRSTSPLSHSTRPPFASAVFTSSLDISRYDKNPSFTTLRRYSRMATTSLLRQAHSLHIDAPVFGILLRDNLVAIHIDWYEEHNGVMEINSAFYPLDAETDIMSWDLNQPLQALNVTAIMSNLRKYTSGAFASRVRGGLKSTKWPIEPWKWDASVLPKVLLDTQLQSHPQEPTEDKMRRWQNSFEVSVNQETKLKRRLRDGRPRPAGSRTDQEFLSPPSTPQSPGDVNPVV